jgi:hypothetical protein
MQGLRRLTFVFAFLGFVATSAQAQQHKRGVALVTKIEQKRVDILIDGEFFTSYRWDTDLKKPILYPINSANGTVITRGFPLEPRAGESVDHPHQSGLWFDYGDVNGVDFWNNSIYRTPEEVKHMGSVVHRRIVEAKDGRTSGELRIEADWVMPDGKTILREATKFIFRAGNGSRSIDRITKLTALREKVVFNDSKEGLFGLRVRRELEQPSQEPIALTDAHGKPMTEKVIDNSQVTGKFRSSDGKTGDDIWGTRAKWSTLAGHVGGEDITIAIFDHPKNMGFPAYCMARGYGLFAVNPLGRKAYENKEALNYTLEPGQSLTLRYRVVISSQKDGPANTEAQYRNFVKHVK